jgi:CO/xanthine dehydrogenase FAD-binding subunit
MATIGGNLAKLHSFNLFPVVLLALDAKVRVLTKTQVKTFRISEIYKNDFKCSFGRDSIIIEIIVPSKTRNWKCIFEKVAKTYSSWQSYANITCAVEIKNKEISNFRFVVGALLPKPIRFESVENIIRGSSIPGRGLEKSMKCLKEELEKIHLTGKISDYKKEVVLGVFRKWTGSLP